MEKLQALLNETWHFYKRTLTLVVTGSTAYYAWCLFLLTIIFIGLSFYLKQHEAGLIVTKMSDQVSWGLYIANFTYLVGAAAAAVLLVIPSMSIISNRSKRLSCSANSSPLPPSSWPFSL